MFIFEIKKKIKYSYFYSIIYQNLKIYWRLFSSLFNKFFKRQFIPDHKNIIYIENTSKAFGTNESVPIRKLGVLIERSPTV